MPKTSKKPSRSKLVKKLDTIFSLYIRLKDSDCNGYGVCFTCGKKDHYKKLQAGHFQSRVHYSTRWDEDNVKIQCLACNMFKGGQQYIFGKNLGQDLAESLYNKSKNIVKFSNFELEEMIEKYKAKVKKIL